MPSFAPLAYAIYGETAYGYPPLTSTSAALTVIPPVNTSNVYDGLQVSWVKPGGNWNQQILIRSSYGVPTEIYSNSGTILLNESGSESSFPWSTSFLDVGLKSGRFYYYALYVFDTDVNEYLFAGGAQGLCLTAWDSSDMFTSWTPDFYLDLDQTQTTTAQPLGPLARFFELLGIETDWVRSEIESMFLFTDSEHISGAMLPALGSNYGMLYEPALGMQRSRVLIENSVSLYKEKGTAAGIAAAGALYTGYGCEMILGPNIEIQLDDAAFDRSIGHWAPQNAGTTIKLSPATTYGITPVHATFDFGIATPVLNVPPGYNPLPTDLALAEQLGVEGYLPVNSENVAQITANSAQTFQWTALAPATSPSANNVPAGYYVGRTGQAMAYDTATNTTLVFGGLRTAFASHIAVVVNDTWSFNGTTWTQLFPAASPPARQSASMVYTTGGNVILFGGQDANFGPVGVFTDVWEWNGTTWTQLSTTGGPPYNPANALGNNAVSLPMTYDASLNRIILVDGNSVTWYFNVGTSTWSTPSVNYAGSYTIPNRTNGALVYLGAGISVFYGGSPSVFGSGDLNDTWQYNSATSTWTLLNASSGSLPNVPSPRDSFGYAAAGSQLILFGGFSGSAFLADTWVFSGGFWNQLSFPPTFQIPAARSNGGQGMTYNSSTNKITLYGGGAASSLLNDTWSFSVASNGVYLSECSAVNATTLGLPVPQTATPPTYVLSAYFRPAVQATPTTEQFYMQLDWYNVNGTFLSSTVGNAVTEQPSAWVRAFVIGTPPAGAAYVGRTVKTVSTAMAGDLHLMDAVQTEYNSLSTPGPTSWSPPRDFWLNLFPVRQNLVPNPVGLGGPSGSYGITATNSSAVGTTTPPSAAAWPNVTDSGWIWTSASAATETFSGTIALNPNIAYSFSFYTLAAAAAKTVSYQVQFLNASNAVLSTVTGSVVESLTAFVSGTLANMVSPATATKAKWQLSITPTAGGEIHYVSSLLFEPSSYIQGYFDGNYSPAPDYTFEGTPNESISNFYPNFSTRISRLATVMPQYIPIGSTFSIYTGTQAFTNTGLVG